MWGEKASVRGVVEARDANLAVNKEKQGRP